MERPACDADEAGCAPARAAHGCRSRDRESRVIAYVDASALVKRHIDERGSRETLAFVARAEVVATSLVSRAEVAAALAKAVRAKLLEEHEAREAQRAFAAQWPDIAKIPVTEALVSRAESLAW